MVVILRQNQSVTKGEENQSTSTQIQPHTNNSTTSRFPFSALHAAQITTLSLYDLHILF